jgi:hypothetical protein
MRKVVQMQVATFEEERRIPWTYDMMGRWAAAHQDGDHLDLELSHFVARETVATLRALLDTPKMAVPQAMLYDLEQMRGVVGATRALLGNQFRVLQRADNFNIAGIVARALDRPDGQATLNFAWIEKWARDPRIEWDAAVASKELKKFEAELGEMSRHPEVVIDRAFGFTQAEPGKGKKDETPGHAVPLLSTIASLFGVPELVPVAVVGGGLAAAVYLVFEKLEADKAARRDDFRELALFASEVERARLLHRLWCAVDAMVRKVRGGRLLVTEQAGRLQLAAPRRDGSSYEVIASDADRVMIAV